MYFLTKEALVPLNIEQAKKEALCYSNLCKIQSEVIATYERQLSEMAAQLGSSNQLVLFAATQLGDMKKRLFGKSSERRLGEDGLPLFDCVDPKTMTFTRKKREKFGRTPLPELPRVEIMHELSEEEIKAKSLEVMEGQFEVSELVQVVPGRYELEVHKRQKYREKEVAEVADEESNEERSKKVCEEIKTQSDVGSDLDTSEVSEASEAKDASKFLSIVTAPGPLKLKEGGKYSISFGVDVGLNKYSFHLPLDRQVRMMKDFGLICSGQVLFAQVDTIAWYLETHVMPGIASQIESSRSNQADETYWENLSKGAKKRFWLWSVKSGKALLFEIFDSRTKIVAKKFLGKLKGVLLTDGFAGYHCLENEELILANDWAHVRRKFLAAEKTHPNEALFFLNQIRLLFSLEEKIKGFSTEQRQSIRTTESGPITQAIYAKCIEYKNVLPKSPLGRAIFYTLKLWKGLTVFLEHPEVPLHTNDIERAQRSPVVGRNNHKGSKSLESAKVAAIWYSVIASCELNVVNPRKYLEETLTAILSKKKVLMPWEWPPPKSPLPDSTPA